MKEPMLTLVENAIRASLGPAADAIPRKDFKVASLAVLMAIRTPSEGMIEAIEHAEPEDSQPGDWDYPEKLATEQWRSMIDAAMQGA